MPTMTDFDRWMRQRLTADDDQGYDADAVERNLAERIGESIRKYRERAGISQTQLAAVLGIGQPTVARMEVGRVTPSFMTLLRLARLLNINFNMVIGPQGGEVSLEDAPKRKPGRSARRRTG
jgi:ribosome-binding protein aMBF1 (putative translation factor)